MIAREREADREGRGERRRDVRHGAEQQHAGADAEQSPQHEAGVRDALRATDAG